MRANLVQTQPFATTFGKAATRKRPKLGVDSYADLLNQVSHAAGTWGCGVRGAHAVLGGAACCQAGRRAGRWAGRRAGTREQQHAPPPRPPFLPAQLL
jgi:hypothetical protein